MILRELILISLGVLRWKMSLIILKLLFSDRVTLILKLH